MQSSCGQHTLTNTGFRFLFTVAALFILFAGGCTRYIPREDLMLPPCESCNEKIKLVTVPLPVIGSSPNEGVTYGALAAFLFHNKNDEISTLLAPQVNENTSFGVTTSLYGAVYFSPERNIEFNLSQSSKVNHDYELKIRDTTFLNNKLELNAFIFKLSDGSSRFYGFQAESANSNETNYANNEVGVNISAGYNFTEYFQLVLGDRFRNVTVGHGAIKKTPYIKDKFTERDVPGLGGFTVHAPRFSLIYSTLDSKDIPTSGYYAKFSMENSFRALGSATNYRHYEAEIKGYYPLDNSRYISVFRLMYNQTLGYDVPFLERSILGGETTLRGYGRNRFIDKSFLLCNMEERIKLFRWEVFNVTADWEIALFMDMGAVMEALDKMDTRSFEINPGVGFRAIVHPNIIGRVDLGIGKEGPSIFVGLGYPF